MAKPILLDKAEDKGPVVALATVVPGAAAQGVAAHFFECFVYTLQGGWAFPLIQPSGTQVHKARNTLCERVKLSPATHILFVDSDEMWSPLEMGEFVQRAHLNKYDVVSGIVNKLEENHVTGQHVTHPSIYDEENMPLSRPEEGGYQEVGAAGAGALLISKRMIVEMKSDWFMPELNTEGRVLGEDLSFCMKVRKMGIKIYADWDFQLGHLKQLAI